MFTLERSWFPRLLRSSAICTSVERCTYMVLADGCVNANVCASGSDQPEVVAAIRRAGGERDGTREFWWMGGAQPPGLRLRAATGVGSVVPLTCRRGPSGRYFWL